MWQIKLFLSCLLHNAHKYQNKIKKHELTFDVIRHHKKFIPTIITHKNICFNLSARIHI